MIAMMVFAVYAHDKSYDVPHIDPDPMEFRVQNIKTRIDETRLNLKEKYMRLDKTRKERRLLLKGSVS